MSVKVDTSMLIKCHISATKKTKSSSPELQPDLSGEGKKIFCQFFRKVIAHTVGEIATSITYIYVAIPLNLTGI